MSLNYLPAKSPHAGLAVLDPQAAYVSGKKREYVVAYPVEGRNIIPALQPGPQHQVRPIFNLPDQIRNIPGRIGVVRIYEYDDISAGMLNARPQSRHLSCVFLMAEKLRLPAHQCLCHLEGAIARAVVYYDYLVHYILVFCHHQGQAFLLIISGNHERCFHQITSEILTQKSNCFSPQEPFPRLRTIFSLVKMFEKILAVAGEKCNIFKDQQKGNGRVEGCRPPHKAKSETTDIASSIIYPCI